MEKGQRNHSQKGIMQFKNGIIFFLFDYELPTFHKGIHTKVN